MLSVCLTSVALQSLLACPWDIGHIFHWSVKDWQRVGEGSSEVATGRGKIVPVLEIGGEKKSHVFRGRKDVLFWGSPPPSPYFFLFLTYRIMIWGPEPLIHNCKDENPLQMRQNSFEE